MAKVILDKNQPEEKRIYTNINLRGKELRNFKLENLPDDPLIGTSFNSRIYYNTTINRIKFFDGIDWLAVSAGDDGVKNIIIDQDSTDYIEVTIIDGVATLKLITTDASDIEHQELSGVGVKTHSEIDDHLASVTNPHNTTLEQARSVDNTFADDVSMGGNKLIALAPGTEPTDAINLSQLQAAQLGLKVHTHAQWATTESLNVSATGSKSTKKLTANDSRLLLIDGGLPSVGDRILVKDEPISINNGIYIVDIIGDDSTPFELSRCPAYDDVSDIDGTPEIELFGGSYFFVQLGITNNSTGWVVQSVGDQHDQHPSVDVDPINFIQFTAANSYSSGYAIVINGSVISFNPEAVAGIGLEVIENKLQVKNYHPLDDTEISITKQLKNIQITNNTIINHNMEGRVLPIFYDIIHGNTVIVGTEYIDRNNIRASSVIPFNANITLIRIAKEEI